MKMEKVEIIVFEGVDNGTYGGDLHIYSSAFWIILPTKVIYTVVSLTPKYSFIILDALSSVIYSILVISIMLSADILSSVILGLKYQNRPRKRGVSSIYIIASNFIRALKNIIIWPILYLKSIRYKDIKLKGIEFIFVYFILGLISIRFGIFWFAFIYFLLTLFTIIFIRRREILILTAFIYSISYPVYIISKIYEGEFLEVLKYVYMIFLLYTLVLLILLTILILTVVSISKISQRLGYLVYDF